MTLRTFILHVEDLPGVLDRVASLFRRRNYNIESLAVCRTDVRGISRMTVTTFADDEAARRIEANLYKLVNVLHVDDTTITLRKPPWQRSITTPTPTSR